MPNPCRHDGTRPRVEIDRSGRGKVSCPECGDYECGDSLEDAIDEWNAFNPCPVRWPWALAGLILAAAFIGGMINA